MFCLDPQAYPAAWASLLHGHEPCPLGPGKPDEQRRAELAALDIGGLAAGAPLADSEMAQCCLAAVWLRHGFLDESHRISQRIGSASGSYWHGIMHRREPDFSNAKYWFRRTGQHPIFESLYVETSKLVGQCPSATVAQSLVQSPRWDPFALVDACELVWQADGDEQQLCRRIAQVEWELLFDHCYRQAVASA